MRSKAIRTSTTFLVILMGGMLLSLRSSLHFSLPSLQPALTFSSPPSPSPVSRWHGLTHQPLPSISRLDSMVCKISLKLLSTYLTFSNLKMIGNNYKKIIIRKVERGGVREGVDQYTDQFGRL